MVGLGNPGQKYEMTRHNAGFLALDLLAQRLGAGPIRQAKCQSLYTCCTLEGRSLLLMKPQTFMNLSGQAVRDMAAAFHVPPERIVVVYDDISLPAGRLRVRRSGSAGGHNGIKDILYQLQSDQFPRIKIRRRRAGPGPGRLERFCVGHPGFRCLRRRQTGARSRDHPAVPGCGPSHAAVQRQRPDLQQLICKNQPHPRFG